MAASFGMGRSRSIMYLLQTDKLCNEAKDITAFRETLSLDYGATEVTFALICQLSKNFVLLQLRCF